MHLDKKLTWKHHIQMKLEQIKIRRSMYWLTRRQSQLNPENEPLIYKTIIKPTYGIELWRTTANNHVKKIKSA